MLTYLEAFLHQQGEDLMPPFSGSCKFGTDASLASCFMMGTLVAIPFMLVWNCREREGDIYDLQHTAYCAKAVLITYDDCLQTTLLQTLAGIFESFTDFCRLVCGFFCVSLWVVQ